MHIFRQGLRIVKHLHQLAHDPVGAVFGIAGDLNRSFKQAHIINAGTDHGSIIFGKAKLRHITLLFRVRKLRQCFPNLFNIFLRKADGRNIRIRKIFIILRVFLAAHSVGFALGVIPSSGFLNNFAAVFNDLLLAARLTFNGIMDRLERIDIFHFRSGAELIRTLFHNGNVYIGTQGTLLHFTV